MSEHGRLLLTACLEALSEQLQRPANFRELCQCVDEQPELALHLWCEHGPLVQEVLEAMPVSLYEHEAVLSLLAALHGEISECSRCLQAYHTTQVRFQLSTSHDCPHLSLYGSETGYYACSASGGHKEGASCCLLSELETRRGWNGICRLRRHSKVRVFANALCIRCISDAKMPNFCSRVCHCILHPSADGEMQVWPKPQCTFTKQCTSASAFCLRCNSQSSVFERQARTTSHRACF